MNELFCNSVEADPTHQRFCRVNRSTFRHIAIQFFKLIAKGL